MIKAKHPASGRTTFFTDMVWKNMGKNKNGWIADDGSMPEIVAAAADVEDSAEYLKLTEQAKGLLTDGKLVESLAKYQAALAIKSNSFVKGQINKITALIETEFAQLVADGDAAVKTQDFETAVEKYGAALDIREDEELDEKFQSAQASLELN